MDKALLRALFLVVSCACFLGCVAPHPPPDVFVDKARFKTQEWDLAFFDFEYTATEPGQVGTLTYDDVGIDAGRSVSAMLSTSIAKLDGVRVVERKDLDVLQDEQALQSSRIVNQDEAVRIGQLMGADAVCLGQVTQFTLWKDVLAAGSTVAFTMKVVSVEDGRLLMSGSVSHVGVSMDLVPNIQHCANQIANSLRAELTK